MFDLTYEGFIEFVQNQPDDRTINHDGFIGCAVGDYVEHVKGNRNYDLVYDVVHKLPENVHDALGWEDGKIYPTYKELKKLVR